MCFLKKIFIIILLLFVAPSLSFAQEMVITQETIDVCNETMLNVYYDIFLAKDQHKELAGFGEDALYENRHGIIAIIYELQPETRGEKDPRKYTPYAFGITLDGLEEDTFPKQERSFGYSFPALGLKISGYQEKHPLKNQYSILPLINKHAFPIALHQQEYLPLKLFVKPVKGSYKVLEEIEFVVTLKNITKRNMIVKSLGRETLYFLVDGRSWGTSPASKSKGGKKVVLKAGEELTARFRGESLQSPKDVEIQGIYRMTVNGVNPLGIVKIKVVE